VLGIAALRIPLSLSTRNRNAFYTSREKHARNPGPNRSHNQQRVGLRGFPWIVRLRSGFLASNDPDN